MLPYVVIAAICVIGVISTSHFLLKDYTSHYFEAAAFVSELRAKEDS